MAPPLAKPPPRRTASTRRLYQLRPASRMFSIGVRCILIWTILQIFGTTWLNALSSILELAFSDSIGQEIGDSHRKAWMSIVWMMIIASAAFVMLNLLMAWASRLPWRGLVRTRRNQSVPTKWVYAKGLGWGACQFVGIVLSIRFCVSFLPGAIRAIDSNEQSLMGFWQALGSQTLLFVALGCLLLGVAEYCLAYFQCRNLEANLRSGRAAS